MEDAIETIVIVEIMEVETIIVTTIAAAGSMDTLASTKQIFHLYRNTPITHISSDS